MVKKTLLAAAIIAAAATIIGVSVGSVAIEPESVDEPVSDTPSNEYLVRDCWYCANNTVIWPDGNIWEFDSDNSGFAYYGETHTVVTAVMYNNGTPGNIYDDVLLGVFAER